MLREISLAEWVAILLATLLCYAFDFLRLYTLLGVLGHRLTLRIGMQAIAVSEFASIATPTAELHIPATVYLLAKRHTPAAAATAAIVAKTLYMILWVSVFGLLALLVPGAPVAEYAMLCAIPLALVAGFFVAVVFFAQPIRRFLDRRPGRVSAWLGRSIRDLALVGSSTRPMHFATHLCAVGYVLAYCLLGYVLCDAFGFEITASRALQVFALGLVVLYIGIVPGSILVAELATAYLLDPDFTQAHSPALFVAIMLRVLSRYVMLIPGAAIFFHSLRSSRNELEAEKRHDRQA
jgi:uncharacterized membrane protein YbhN (UPF0104 family)